MKVFIFEYVYAGGLYTAKLEASCMDDATDRLKSIVQNGAQILGELVEEGHLYGDKS